MKKIILIFQLLSLLCQYIVSQDIDSGLIFDLTVRYRFELWDGFNAKNYGDDSPDAIGKLNDKVLLQKIIPGIIYSNRKIIAAFHMQDSRAFGWSLRQKNYPDLFKKCDPGSDNSYYIMNPQEEYFEIYDLYFEYKELLKNLSVKAGRQKIYYGDWRIFEQSIWGNTGRWTWDAIKISYRKNNNFIDIFGGGTKTHDPLKISIPFTQTEFWGGGLYAHKELTPWLYAEPFYAIRTEGSAAYMKSCSINRNWTGLRLASPENRNLIYDILFTYHFGNDEGQKINASGYALKAGYRFNGLPATPEFNLNYTYASGDKENDNINQAFDPPYGARSRFYGWMGIASWSNLSYPQIIIKFYPAREKMLIEMKYSRIYLPEPDNCLILNTMKIKEGSHHLGDETDLNLRYNYNDHWQFAGIFCHFNPGDLEKINFKDPADAFWMGLQLQYTLN